MERKDEERHIKSQLVHIWSYRLQLTSICVRQHLIRMGSRLMPPSPTGYLLYLGRRFPLRARVKYK